MQSLLKFPFLLFLSLGLPCLAAAQQDDWVPSHEQSVELAEDIQDVPSLDLRVDKDPFKRVFLIGLDEEQKAPRGGYGVIVVLPGSHGGPSFASFVHRIHKYAVPKGFLTLQLVAPEWKQGQHNSLTWVTERHGLKQAEFTTEVFVTEALAEVARRTKINKKKVYSLSWSSGGPPAYSLSLQKKSPL